MDGVSSCTFFCPICAERIEIKSWEWVDEEGALIWDRRRESWLLVVNASSEYPVSKDEVLAYLPTEISAVLADGTKQKVMIAWDEEQLDMLDGKAYAGSCTIPACLEDGFYISDKAGRLRVTLEMNHPNAAALTEDDLAEHTVPGLNPPNTTVNLFDYSLSEEVVESASDDRISTKFNGEDSGGNGNLTKHVHRMFRTDGTFVENYGFARPSDVNEGINKNHLLLFGDGISHAGLWNRGAGRYSPYGQLYANMQEIVQRKLVNGFPVVNLDNAKKTLTNESFTDPRQLAALNGLAPWNSYPPEDIKSLLDQAPFFETAGNPNRKKVVESIRYYNISGDCTALTSKWIQPYNVAPNSQGNYYPNLSDIVLNQWGETNPDNASSKQESLDYLFDTDKTHDGKRVVEDVKGLFQIDEEGYYYYNMRYNFAEYREVDGENRFILYDSGATVRSDGDQGDSIGNFFPFNKGTEVFSGISADGELESGVPCSGNNINHYLGMTVELSFRQPINGKVNMGSAGDQPMVFNFSGDDDVWIFVDDVLVLDIGGIHSDLYGIIDFATGDVYVGQGFDIKGIPDYESGKIPDQCNFQTTLKEQFELAGEDTSSFNGGTFASNTSHTLKMFYMERGNYDSSLALRFNLQPSLYQQIKKVDQNGDPLENVEFALYPAERAGGAGEGALRCTNLDGVTVAEDDFYYVRQTGSDPVAVLTTGKDGTARFVQRDANGDPLLDRDGNEIPYNFIDHFNGVEGEFYILKEATPPTGYRPPPVDIVLQLDETTAMLSVANRWSSASYASFVSYITGMGEITYGHCTDASNGEIEADDSKRVGVEDQRDSLIVAIPTLKVEEKDEDGNVVSTSWRPLYGSNTGANGFSAVKKDESISDPVAEWRKAVLIAVLEQCKNETYPSWYLTWDDANRRLTGELTDLPGFAGRYALNNPDPAKVDMRMVYGIIVPEALDHLGIQGATSKERYAALNKYMETHTVEAIAGSIMDIRAEDTGSGQGFSFLNVDQFERNFRSLIYIANEQRQLRVRKVDEDNNPVEGAEFTLTVDKTGREEIDKDAPESAKGVTNEKGELVFAPGVGNSPGYGDITWAQAAVGTRYILRETSVPAGYQQNNTEIPVIVGYYSIYADAGDENDGVSVMAGVGKLAQTMVKYATDGDVDITLQDITAFAQTQPSGQFDVDNGWQDLNLEETGSEEIKRTMNLHYKMNEVIDYGLHDSDGGNLVEPFFFTDTGFLRARVEQNTGFERYGCRNGRIDDIEGVDITGLFSLVNTVVVTDKKDKPEKTGELSISKMLAGDGLQREDYTHNFSFTVEFTDPDGNALPGEYKFYGTDKEGFITNGETIPLHHDEEIVIKGLPAGTKYKVTEKKEEGFYPLHPIPFPSSKPIVLEGVITNTEPETKERERADFINGRNPLSSLTIRKTVAGVGGDEEKDFSFLITFTGADGEYAYFGERTQMDGKTPKTAIKSGDAILLRHGEEITIVGLPVGTGYTVTETEEDGYKVTSQNATGTLKSENGQAVDMAAEFTNELVESAFAPKVKKVIAGVEPPRDEEFTFTIDEYGENPKGGAVFTGEKSVIVKGAEIGEFGKIQFLKQGTYRFIIREAIPKDEDKVPGYSYDNTLWILTVEVKGIELHLEKAVYGRLEEDNTITVPPDQDAQTHAMFTNTYTPVPVTYAPKIEKTVNGKTADQGVYTFTLTPAEDNPEGAVLPRKLTASVTGRGQAVFEAVSFAKAGSYQFTIQEQEGTLPGCTYDSGKWDLTVSVVLEKGILRISEVKYQRQNGTEEDNEAAKFVNAYTAEYAPRVGKIVTGKDGDRETYTFTLSPVEGNPEGAVLPEQLTASVIGGGQTEFGKIRFTEKGTYWFEIREVKPGQPVPDCDYDASVWVLTADVSNSGPEGMLEVSAHYEKKAEGEGEAEGDFGEEAVFVNAYLRERSVSYRPEVRKIVTGKDGDSGIYTFTLTPAEDNPEGAVLPADREISITGSGQADFGEIIFTKVGIYQFEIREKIPEHPVSGCTYDTSVWTLTVTVAEKDGALEVLVDYTRGNSKGSAAEFTNAYKPDRPDKPDQPDDPGSPDDPDDPDEPPPPTGGSLSVTKRWILDDGKQAAESVTVGLYRDGVLVDTAVLTSKNNWSYRWSELESGYIWTIEEENTPRGFRSTVSNRGTRYTITNDDIPEPPDTGMDWKLIWLLGCAGLLMVFAGVKTSLRSASLSEEKDETEK